ncbi:MAG: TIGR00730 family Rossman fold protein [Planctomycetes bacterium]|nr:TIGR00730 family Rossman fold protein [Planctomycetota bacterium]
MTEESGAFDLEHNLEQILASPTYRRAEDDPDFIKSPRLRPMRLAMELLKPEVVHEAAGINSTIVLFGGTRVVQRSDAEARLAVAREALAASPDDPDRQRDVRIAESVLAKSGYYDEARRFARIVSENQAKEGPKDHVIVTGGGPGIMEAGNRGAQEAGAVSIGLNITLPHEQAPNGYITPSLCFQFHYFGIRKMHFLLRARAMLAFPGGFGTMDELFETLTLVQTRTMRPIPIILFGEAYWRRIVNFEAFVEEGTIAPKDLEILSFAETADQAWDIICRWYEEHAIPDTSPIHRPL